MTESLRAHKTRAIIEYMRTALIFFLSILLLFSFIGGGDTASAQVGGLVPCGRSADDPGTININESKMCDFRDIFVLLHNILDFAIFTLAPILVTAMVAVGGFKMLISAGDPSKYKDGLSYIKNAVIGYAIVLVSMLIVNTVLQQIGVAEWTGLLNWEIINF